MRKVADEGDKTVVDLVRGDFIVINLRKAKSIKNLMCEIQSQLAFSMLLHPELKARDFKRGDAGLRNWDLVLRAGDLAIKGLGNKQIAMRLFPGDFDHKSKSKESKEAHRRSAEAKAAKLVSEFRRLEGISFP